MRSHFLLIVGVSPWFCGLFGVALAGPPTITEIFPPGGRAGAPVVLTISGTSLSADAELIVPLTTAASLVTDDAALSPTSSRVAFRLLLADHEAPGPRILRVRTREGLSNPVLFAVGFLPECSENEPNDLKEGLPLLALPTVINGRVSRTDRDVFRVHVQAGERLVFEVDARRLGSSLDPTLRLCYPDGRELALAEDTDGLDVDARIVHTFQDAGDYLVELRDATYSVRTTSFYRLRIGDFDHADAVFPLGGRAGSDIVVHFDGGSLRRPLAARIQLPGNELEDWTSISLPPSADGGGAMPFRLRIGDFPEVFEATSTEAGGMVAPVTVNGRLDEPGEVDRHVLRAEPGSSWALTLDANALGSWLDGVLQVLREDGAELASADDDGKAVDPRLEFTMPPGVSSVVIAVKDLLGRGGKAFGYRLTVRPARPDFVLKLPRAQVELPLGGTALLEVECLRRGYAGPIRLTPRLAGQHLKVQGGAILPEQTRGFLTVTAVASTPPGLVFLGVLGTAEGEAATLARVGRGQVFLADEHGTPSVPLSFGAVVLASTSPLPLGLEVNVEAVELVVGAQLSVPVRVWRREGIRGEIEINAVSLPPGVTMEAVKIPPGESTGTIVLKAAAGARVSDGDGILRAELQADGVTSTAFAPAIGLRVRGAR